MSSSEEEEFQVIGDFERLDVGSTDESESESDDEGFAALDEDSDDGKLVSESDSRCDCNKNPLPIEELLADHLPPKYFNLVKERASEFDLTLLPLLANVIQDTDWSALIRSVDAILQTYHEHVSNILRKESCGASAGDSSLNLVFIFLAIRCSDHSLNLKATMAIRKLISMRSAPITALVNAPYIVPSLIKFLESADETLQFEASWALTNLVSGNSHDTRLVVSQGVLAPIASILKVSQSLNLLEQCLWLIGNVAGDSAELRDLVFEHCDFVVQSICDLVSRGVTLSLQRNCVWVLSNLCRSKPQPDFKAIIDAGALKVLAEMLDHCDSEVQTDTCWALSYISDSSNDTIEAIIDAGCIPKLCKLLEDGTNRSTRVAALRTIGNIVTGSDFQTQFVVDTAGFLASLKNLLSNGVVGIRKEAAWTLSNIAAGNATQIQSVIDIGVVPRVLNMLQTEADASLVKECIWVLCNMTHCGTSEQLQYLIHLDCIDILCQLLRRENLPLTVVLDALLNFMRDQDFRDNRPKSSNGRNVRDLLHNSQNFTVIKQCMESNSMDVVLKATKLHTSLCSDTFSLHHDPPGEDSDDEV